MMPRGDPSGSPSAVVGSAPRRWFRMSRRLRVSAIGLLAFGLAEPAAAERYNLSARAGENGDDHTSNNDPDVSATYSQSDGPASETYEATASSAGGSFFARALRSGQVPAGTTSASINIEE